MSWNHRYVLRVSTDSALWIFTLFALGGTLWMVDEFLDWNILPDWIDRYVQVIVLLIGAAAGLAIATSLLCSVVVVAEAAAERARIPEVQTNRQARRWIGWSAAAIVVGLLAFHRVDIYRKGQAQRVEAQRHRASYEATLKEVRQSMDNALKLFPNEMAAGLANGNANTNEVITFLSALQSSTPHHPDVHLLLRAPAPYLYVSLHLRPGRGDGALRFELDRQYYTGFPSELERQAVDQLLNGEPRPLQARVQGEVLNNIFPSAWGLVGQSHEAILVFRAEFPDRDGLYHPGPAAPVTVLSANSI